MMNSDSRCKARTKRGEPCRAAATEGGLCFFHANPNKAAELGRIGGRKKGHARAEAAAPLPTLDNALAVRDTVARLIEDLHSGKLHPKMASGFSSLLSLQLRTLETTDLERRLVKLEQLVTKIVAAAEKKRRNGEDISCADTSWGPSAGPEESSTTDETQSL
jgi:hypothetical protein